MPMSSYKIDKFLTEKLKDIGFLSDTEINNAELTTTLSEFAHWSVGCNPRSLKRLTNTLSLISLITDKTRNEQDNSDFKDYKALNFALVCIQNTYPAIYNALLIESDFRESDKPQFYCYCDWNKLADDQIIRLLNNCCHNIQRYDSIFYSPYFII